MNQINKYFLVAFSMLLLSLLFSCKSKSVAKKNIAVKNIDSVIESPQWIKMMNDSNVNYYQAVQAFNTYWEHREKATENDGEGRNIYDNEKGKDEKKNIEFVYEYKQFLNWQLRYKNFVKADGTIMTQQEIKEQSEKEIKLR